MNKERYEAEVQRGYTAAQKTMQKGTSAQAAYNASLGDLEGGGYQRGWQQACIEAGAKGEE